VLADADAERDPVERKLFAANDRDVPQIDQRGFYFGSFTTK
jgi:hypothetical protein